MISGNPAYLTSDRIVRLGFPLLVLSYLIGKRDAIYHPHLDRWRKVG
ncbi:MAG: hypothetical protein J7641_18230 [Cyanobacteria bacterium SID2]|nr:hypothetical protein [Cyanobacteria bacterium SID2]MBP0005438.1 hypothetical protein [Cyanobacteria bacterium SBC]